MRRATLSVATDFQGERAARACAHALLRGQRLPAARSVEGGLIELHHPRSVHVREPGAASRASTRRSGRAR